MWWHQGGEYVYGKKFPLRLFKGSDKKITMIMKNSWTCMIPRFIKSAETKRGREKFPPRGKIRCMSKSFVFFKTSWDENQPPLPRQENTSCLWWENSWRQCGFQWEIRISNKPRHVKIVGHMKQPPSASYRNAKQFLKKRNVLMRNTK